MPLGAARTAVGSVLVCVASVRVKHDAVRVWDLCGCHSTSSRSHVCMFDETWSDTMISESRLAAPAIAIVHIVAH
jgi:hypothetical protein